ncbi:zinc finger protein RFP-like isoform X2 [Hemicordylus capensis]|uniref:zinc finger protein RFP-like isoform X2 n=1 Tax=Hemicordylus capensis TaxID=884348 RepID=UPI0023022FFC|nr:zinc finger protein RFP-like isoform X2 [Hemicordylus capensis]
MAAEGPVQNLCDETTCSICLEYFKDPVIIDCGHNFCRACITQCWGESGTDASCPQCREIVTSKNFKLNRPLASIVEIAKKFSLQMAKGAEALGKVCEKHQEPLKLFCEDDQAPICVVCDKSKEHREHKVIPKEEAFEEYKGKILSHLEFLKQEREAILSFKLSGESEGQNFLEQTETERQKIVAEFKQLHQFLEEQECLLLDQLDALEKEIKENGNRYIAKLSEAISSVDNLIKEMEEKQKQPATEFLQDIKNILQRCNDEKFVNPIAFSPELKQQIEEFSEMHPFLETVMKEFQGTVLSGPQKEANLSNTEDVTIPTLVLLNYNEFNQQSHQVQQSYYYGFGQAQHHYYNKTQLHQAQQSYSNGEPIQLCCSSCILGVERITSGCHSWMVEVGGEKFWAVGVATEHLRGKADIHLSPENGIWAVGKIRGTDWNTLSITETYYAFTSHGTYLGQNPDLSKCRKLIDWCGIYDESMKPRKICVSLNYEEGSVTFFDAVNKATMFTFSNVSFSGQKICFWLSVGK